MRRLIATILLISLLSAVVMAERIVDYGVRIQILPDGVVEVAETIVYNFDFPRHGIYRDIPLSYRLSNGTSFSTRVHLEEVRADGKPVPIKVSHEGRFLRIRIGDPNRLVEGNVTYTIRYSVLRALRRYGDEVELYWNAIGTGWAVPIGHAKVEVLLPEGIPPEKVRYQAYVGSYGSQIPFALEFHKGELSGETSDLEAGKGITVVVRFPEGYVSLPSAFREALWFLRDNLYLGVPLLVLLGMTAIWFSRGRDPRVGTIAPEFSPPEEVGPAGAGVLVDDRFDPRDLVAGIISLATKGYLRLREVWEGNGKDPSDFELHRTGKGPGNDLTPFERKLLDALFSDRGRVVRLGDLKYEFYDEVQALSAELYGELTRRGFYAGNPDRVRDVYRGIALGLVVLGVAIGVLWGSLYAGLAVGGSALIVWAFSYYMPKKTRKGTQVLRRILGLEEYIRRAEAPRLEFAAAEEHFEELLPYAVAFGLAERWARKFEGILRRPPDWYEGRFPTFSPYLFGWRLLAFQQVAHQAAFSAPRSAGGGWSGGSGFGGGFAGGGMGGGGGGSW